MSNFIHGDNIDTKIRSVKGPQNKELLKEIKARYLIWKGKNLRITGTTKGTIQ